MASDALADFARLLRALEPYLEDIVLLGGWVHALYLRELEPAPRTVRTTDVDITVPRQLSSHHRPELLQLVEEAGFEIEQLGSETGLLLIRKGAVDLDIFCATETPSDIIPIEGQSGLYVQGYPYLDMMLDSSRRIRLGPDLHPVLDPDITVRIPGLAAYSIGRILSAQGRPVSRRRTKDLVYLCQVMLERRLRDDLLEALPDHVREYPEASTSAVEALSGYLEQTAVLRDVAQQIRELGFLPPEQDTLATLKAQLRRLQAELQTRIAGE